MEKDKSQLDDQVLYIVSIQIDRQLDEKKKEYTWFIAALFPLFIV